MQVKQATSTNRSMASALFLLPLLFALSQAPSAAAVWPIDTGFETPDYAVGNLNGQNGWITTNTAAVQSDNVHTGLQAVRLTSQSQASYGASQVNETVIVVEGYYKMTPTSDYPNMTGLEGATCILFYHATDGLTCLDGDGLGTGTWRASNILVDEWTKIGIRQNYENNKWDLFVNNELQLACLGNAYIRAGFAKFECQSGDAGPLLFDDFSANKYIPPRYPLAITAQNGSVTKLPDQADYEENTLVELTPVPDFDYLFVGWSGPNVPLGQNTAIPLVLTMDTTKTITALFEEIISTYTLTVLSENGTAGKAPDQPFYDEETPVTLTPTPAADYRFTGWSGDIAAGQETDNPLTVIMSGNKTITTHFEAIPRYAIAITVANGAVAKNPDQADYLEGSQVALTATPIGDYRFTSWSGADVPAGQETANPLTLTMDAAKNVTANFAAIPRYAITITTANGTVAKNPDQADYLEASQVILTPAPAAGYRFLNWSGADTPAGQETANPLTLTMNAAKNVTANFELIPSHAITITAENGTVTKTPDQADYLEGSTVTLQATAAVDYYFQGWSGDVPAQQTGENPTVITVDSAKNITAIFRKVRAPIILIR